MKWPVVLIMSLLFLGGSPAAASRPAQLLGTPTATTSAPAAVCPPGIGFGETIQCSISSPGEVDTYTFTASAGDKVLLRIADTSSDIWPEVRVRDSGGIEQCAAYGTASAEIATCTLPGGGTYSILATDRLSAETGDYYLYLQRLNNPGSALPITFGQTLPGSILTPAEMDTYTFTASPGDKVLLRIADTSGDIWPEVRVYDPAGAKQCDAYGTASAEIATCTLPGGGTYSILATDRLSAETGDYYLYLQRLNNPGSALPITFGQTLPGSILTPAQMDTYTFTVTTSDTVGVRMRTVSGDLWPGIRLYGPDGTKLCEDEAASAAEIAACPLPGSGAYTILAFDSLGGTLTGGYRLYLDCCTIHLPLVCR